MGGRSGKGKRPRGRQPTPGGGKPWSLRTRLLAGSAAAVLLLILLVAVRFYLKPGPPNGDRTEYSVTALQEPRFAGASACAECHRAEFKLWNGSHHQLAMQPATDNTVLGN